MRAFDHGVKHVLLRRRLVLAVHVGCLFLIYSGWCAADENSQAPLRVLVLYDEGRDLKGLDLVKEGFETTLLAETERPVEFYHEYLDASRFQEEEHHILFADYLKTKYAKMRLDLVVPVIHTRMSLASHIPRDLFPDVPIVFASSPASRAETITPVSMMTGVLFRIDAVKGLKTALAVRPQTRRVIVVAGPDKVHSKSIAGIVDTASSHPGIAFEYWTDRTGPQILDAAASLPRDSLVYYLELYRDSEGASYLPWQFGQSLAEAASVPVFGVWESYLGTGVVGGAVVSLSSLGVETARLALRVLNSERASAIPVIDTPSVIPMFDWRAMQRWDISMADLPPGSVVRFRPPPLWETHRMLVIAGSTWTVILLIALVTLAIQRLHWRRVEAQLQQSEQQLRLVADSMPALIAYVDSGQRYLWVNKTYEDWWKQRHATMKGKHIREVLGEEGFATVRRHVEAVLAGKSVTFETIMPHPTSGPRDVLVNYVPDVAEDVVRGFFALISDITDLHHARRQAEHDRAALAHALRLSTAAELTTSLAHELNQPLNAILNNAQAGLRFLGRKAPDLKEVEEVFADIVANDKRAGDIIHRLRALLRRDLPQCEALDINDAIGDVLDILHSEVINQGVLVETDLAAHLPRVQCDRIQLQQIFINLIINAQQAMKGVQADPCTLFIKTAKDAEGRVVIHLQDTGPGIEEDMRERIFDPFKTTKAGGMGMGLTISRSIAEANNGTLWAENAPEGGARFSLAFPTGDQT